MQTSETQTREEWLAGLKVGDEVVVRNDYFSRWERIETITKESATRLTAGPFVFRKDNGFQWGGSARSPLRIMAVTEKIRERLHRDAITRELQDLVKKIDTYSTATLEAAIAVLKGENDAAAD